LEIFGENVKLAGKRRRLTTIEVADRANISRNTLYLIEKGNSGVSIGAIFNVLRVLGLQDDFLLIAQDDIFDRKLQHIELHGKKDNVNLIIPQPGKSQDSFIYFKLFLCFWNHKLQFGSIYGISKSFFKDTE